MKLLFLTTSLIILTGISSIAQKQHIDWINLEKAQNLAAKDSKFVLIDMQTSWCGPCRQMEATTFSDSAFISFLTQHAHSVKFNAEGPDKVKLNGKEFSNPQYDEKRAHSRNSPHELTRHFGVPGYPSIIILDKDGNVVKKLVGYRTAEQLRNELMDLIKAQ